jgi:hypothetical protein
MPRYIVVLIVVIAAACSAVDDSQADHSFTTDKPCAAPCWYGLEPDHSTKADVVAVLKQLEFVDSTSIKEYGTRWSGDDHALGITFGCVHPQTATCGSAVISGDKLKSLLLSAGSKLTVKMTVDKLGIPDYVDYGPYAPEVGGCNMVLSWPQRGIGIQMLETRNETVCRALRSGQGIPPDLRMTALSYSVQEALPSGPGGCCTRISWPGFAKP